MSIRNSRAASFIQQTNLTLQPHKEEFSSKYSRLLTLIANNGLYYTFINCILVANACIFCYGVWYQINAPILGLSNYILPVGRGFGLTLELNCALILIPMCHSILTYLRHFSVLTLFIPFNHLRDIHIFIARLIGIGTFFHAGLQLIHFISASILESHNIVWSISFRGSICVFITGWLLVLILMIIIFFAIEPIKKRLHFEWFFYSHHLFIVFYILLLIHGQRAGRLEFWKWFLLPGFLYVIDRIYRLVSLNCITRACKVISIEYYSNSKVIRLEIPKVFSYKTGQYAELKIPEISITQSHPFTIASSPKEDSMVFYIKEFGKWTKNLGIIAEHFKDNPEELIVHVGGPFGAPAQFSFHFDDIILIGTGIGATPCVSAMKHAMLSYNPENIKEKHQQAIELAKHHIQTIEAIEDDLPEVSNTQLVHLAFSHHLEESIEESEIEVAHHKPITKKLIIEIIILRIYRIFSAIISYVIELWIVLLCILIESINWIFFESESITLTVLTVVFLVSIVLSLSMEYIFEILVLEFKHYWKACRNLVTLLDVPIVLIIVIFNISIQFLKYYTSKRIEIAIFILLGILFLYLFIRLTLRAGAKNLLQLPNRKKLSCVSSVDFLWVNSKNTDVEWMLDDLHELENMENVNPDFHFNKKLFITREDPVLPDSLSSINLIKGRPNWDAVFDDITYRIQNYGYEEGSTVGVFFCGSPVVGDILRNICIRETAKTRNDECPIFFIFHQEIF